MKTENHSINDVLAKNATSFFIPPFQRAYAWGKPEIERYFSDVLRIIDSELNNEKHEKLEHFFGTVVIKEERSGFANKSVVVDGQQRLTTTLLFLIALRDIESDLTKRDFITQNYLINNTSTFQDKIKLKQVTKDWDAYRALIKQEQAKPGIINNAHQLFLKLIKKTKETNPKIQLEHYIIALQRMNVAVIFLDERPFKGEDPQVIFETLNSLGKPLTLSDLIRNFVLLNMNSDQQSDIYEKIWHPKIEFVLNEYVSEFFRDYLQYKTASSVKVVSDNNTKEIYQLFKTFVENKFDKRIDFVNDIVRYSNWYKWIISEEFTDSLSPNSRNNSELKELIRNIFHDIKSEAFKPFVLGLLEYHQDGVESIKLSDDLCISILKTIQVYLIRRRILGLTQGENKSIVLFSNRIKDLAVNNISMHELLSNMFYRMRFPNDNEMKDKLMNLNFYEGLKKYSKFILGKIEEHRTKIFVDFRNRKITIERIMPHKLDDVWKDELGSDFENIHKNYLHNIGNLILTEFNIEIGDQSFSEKKTKLNSSSLSYRLSVISKDTWNLDSILEHQKNMITWFLEAFPLPDVFKNAENWNSKINENLIFSPMDTDAGEIAEGNKPVEIHIEDTVFKVSTWQDVFIQFLKYIRDNQNFDFEFILYNQTELFNRENVILKWFSLKFLIDHNNDLKDRYKTFDGKIYSKVKNITQDEIFIHIKISASTCMNRIANIMNKFNMPENFVRLVLRK